MNVIYTPYLLDLPIYELGKPFIRHLKKVGDKYKISKKIKGVHQESVVKNMITQKKIEKVFNYFHSKGMQNPIYSNSTKSIYFSIGSRNFRISDHPKQFDGISIIIKYNSDISKFN